MLQSFIYWDWGFFWKSSSISSNYIVCLKVMNMMSETKEIGLLLLWFFPGTGTIKLMVFCEWVTVKLIYPVNHKEHLICRSLGCCYVCKVRTSLTQLHGTKHNWKKYLRKNWKSHQINCGLVIIIMLVSWLSSVHSSHAIKVMQYSHAIKVTYRSIRMSWWIESEKFIKEI